MPPVKDTEDSATYALMYLYVCTKDNCGKEPGSWRALRCQWRSPTPPKKDQPATVQKITNIASKSTPATILSTSGWGLGDTHSEEDTKPASSGFDFSDLEAALDAMNQKPAAPAVASNSSKLATAEKQIEEIKLPEIKLLQVEDESAVVPLPGFYLDVTESQVLENRLQKQNGSGGGGGGSKESKDDDSLMHVQELLIKYGDEGEIERLINYEDDEEEEEKEGKSQKGGGGRDKKSKAETAADPITWEGEGYEEDVVLAVEGRKGVDQTFLKFMKKLQRIPDQCVRQGRGGGDGELLWPSSSKKVPDAGKCSSCGAPRVFEYQLMAPTIAALEESADWLKDEGLEDGAVERPPVSWDWVTVAVFGCRERCDGGSDVGVYREGKVVVCEEE